MAIYMRCKILNGDINFDGQRLNFANFLSSGPIDIKL